jgi:hypothetical protein
LVFLLFQPLFTESSCGDQLLASPPFSCVLSEFLPLLLCASFQLIVYCSGFFFCWGGVSLPRVGMLVYPRGGWGSTMWCLALTCLVCQISPKQVWSWCLIAWKPSCFLSVTWHGEAFYGLGAQGVEVLILLGALFLPSVAPVSQQGFCFTELTLSASAP